MDYNDKMLFERYSGLLVRGWSERNLKDMYKGVCSGKFYYGHKDMNKYLDILAEKGELLNFINFLNDASNYFYDVTYGEDKMIDAVADTYSHSKTVTYGYGGSERSLNAKARVELLIQEIKFNYSHKIQQEQDKRDAAHMNGWVAEREAIAAKVQKYMEALKIWNAKDCYWKSANFKKRPTPDKFDVTEENLIDFGFYSDENKSQRYMAYQQAMQKFEESNSTLKYIFYLGRGKTAPLPQEYGLTMDDVMQYNEGFGYRSSR